MSDSKAYPLGSGMIKTRYLAIAGVPTLLYDRGPLYPGVRHALRTRLTIAQINAGADLLPAIPGFKYRLHDASAIAYGGAVTAVTTVDVLATQGGSSVKLVAFGQAALAQSAVVRAGSAGGVVLANGASLAPNDVNTAIRALKNGSDITVATGVDFLLSYSIEAV